MPRYITSSCLRKHRYHSRQEAENALGRFVAMGYNVPGKEVYSCRFCSGWHTGEKRVKVRP